MRGLQESLKSQLKAKIELAKFLQDTTEEMAKMLSSKRTGDVQVCPAVGSFPHTPQPTH